MGLDVLSVIIASISLLVATVAAIAGVVQARSARDSAATAKAALEQSESQATSARDSADSARIAAETAVEQARIARVELEHTEKQSAVDAERRQIENRPRIEVTVGALRQQLEPLERPSTSKPTPRVELAWLRSVRVTRRGGPRTADLSFSIDPDRASPTRRPAHIVEGSDTARLDDHESTTVEVSLGPELAPTPITADFVATMWDSSYLTGESWRLSARVDLLTDDDISTHTGR